MENNNLYVSPGLFRYWITTILKSGATEFKIPTKGDYFSGIVIESNHNIKFDIYVNGYVNLSNINSWLPDYNKAIPVDDTQDIIVKIYSISITDVIFRIEYLKCS